MVECDQNELLQLLDSDEQIFLYVYSTFCGTCQVASRMIEALPFKEQIPIYSCNLNFMPVIAQTFQIESVPCLLIVEKNTIIEKIYSFRSINYLTSVFYKYLNIS